MKTPNPQYIYNEKGKPTMVVLSVKEYEALLKKQAEPKLTPAMQGFKESFDYIRDVKAGRKPRRTLDDMLKDDSDE